MLNPKPKMMPLEAKAEPRRSPRLQRIAKYFALSTLTVSILLVTLFIGAAWYASGQIMFLKSIDTDIGRSPAEIGLKYEDVEFDNDRGIKLSGWFVPGHEGARAALVTVHGASGNRSNFTNYLPMFHQ